MPRICQKCALCQLSLDAGDIVRILGISVVYDLDCLTEGVHIGILNNFDAVVLDLLQLTGFLVGNPGALVFGGFLRGVLICFVLIAGSLRLLPRLETVMLAKARNMNIFIEFDSVEDLSRVVENMKASGIRLYDVEMGKLEKAGASYVTGLFTVNLPQRRDHTELLAELSLLPGVAAIEEV